MDRIFFDGEEVAVEFVDGDLFGYPIENGKVVYEEMFEIDDSNLLTEVRKAYGCTTDACAQNLFCVSRDTYRRWKSGGMTCAGRAHAVALLRLKRCEKDLAAAKKLLKREL